jgi:hypothetical protein
MPAWIPAALIIGRSSLDARRMRNRSASDTGRKDKDDWSVAARTSGPRSGEGLLRLDDLGR